MRALSSVLGDVSYGGAGSCGQRGHNDGVDDASTEPGLCPCVDRKARRSLVRGGKCDLPIEATIDLDTLRGGGSARFAWMACAVSMKAV